MWNRIYFLPKLSPNTLASSEVWIFFFFNSLGKAARAVLRNIAPDTRAGAFRTAECNFTATLCRVQGAKKRALAVFTCVVGHEIEYYRSRKMQIKLKPERIVFGITAARSPQVFAEAFWKMRGVERAPAPGYPAPHAPPQAPKAFLFSRENVSKLGRESLALGTLEYSFS